MADQAEIENVPVEDNPVQKKDQMDNLQKVIKTVSCLPCCPDYEPKADTPNIDQLKLLFVRFTNIGDSETRNVEVVKRSSAEELSQWTQTVLKFLPGVDDSPEEVDRTNQLTHHFTTIKHFYSIAKNAGFESPELDTFFNSLQIYESVVPLAFFVLQDHPDILDDLTGIIKKAIEKVTNHDSSSNKQGCFMLIICGAFGLLANFNRILGAIDKAIGRLNITKVAEIILDLFEVFCRYFKVDLSSSGIETLANNVQQVIRDLSNVLRTTFHDVLPEVGRVSQWGPLKISGMIRAKLAEIDTGSAIVERTMNSFARFFDAVQKVDDKYVGKKTEGDLQEALQEMKQVAQVFQRIEEIMTYGVLVFKNEDEVLNPLLDQVDECTRILSKFFGLHPLYQVLLGKNYLSKLKVVLNNVLQLLKNSNLKINSPQEFLNEVNRQYPNLVMILLKDVLDEPLKNVLNFLSNQLGQIQLPLNSLGQLQLPLNNLGQLQLPNLNNLGDMKLPDNLSDIQLPFEIQLPNNLNGIKIPNVQDIQIPNVQDIQIPNVQDIQIPNVQDIQIPNIQHIQIPNVQDIKIPNIPQIKKPKFW